MAFVVLVPVPYFSVKMYGALGDGSTDDTTAIQNTITAAHNAGGGIVYFPTGTYIISAPLTVSNFGIQLVGIGAASKIQPSGTFSGAEIILLSADFAGVRDMTIVGGSSTTYSSNPATNGIEISGARSARLENVYLNYINGWAVESKATASIANYGVVMSNLHPFSCAQGIHILGNSGSSYNMQHYLANCNCDSIQNGDCYLIEDAHDVLGSNIYGVVTAGSGSSMHIKGASAALYFSNIDWGPAPGPSTGPIVLIETGTNGTPKQVVIEGGIILGGATGISITAGTQIHISHVDIINNGTYGVNITGGDALLFNGCSFLNNGVTAGSGRYDFQSSTSNHVEVNGCYFGTAQGSSTQQTNNAVNVTAGTVAFLNTSFYGTGYTTSNMFNSFPTIIRNCPGFNPYGNVTAPTIGASPYTAPVKSYDTTVYITGGTVSSVTIGGVSTGLTSGTFRVPASQAIGLVYTVAPTWVWWGD